MNIKSKERLMASLDLHVGAFFLLCVELDVTSTGNTGSTLVLINSFSSSSFFICDLSGEGGENSHLIRMPSAVFKH